jgi:hypothetical protein
VKGTPSNMQPLFALTDDQCRSFLVLQIVPYS